MRALTHAVVMQNLQKVAGADASVVVSGAGVAASVVVVVVVVAVR